MFLCVPLPDASTVTVSGPEGRHAATVHRLRVGEAIDLTDGAGTVARCTVAAVEGPDRVVCAVESRQAHPVERPRLTVVQALPKGERAELAVELMTEVGVDEIVPWAASRCVTRWEGERGRRSRARWETAAGRAARQSRRVRWPLVAELAGTPDVAARLEQADLAIVLWERADEPLTSVLAGAFGREEFGREEYDAEEFGRDALGPDAFDRSASDQAAPGSADLPAGGPAEIVLVVGPEGSMSDAEIAAFVAAGARPAVLGPTVLRTSTAGAVAATVVLAASPRWRSAARSSERPASPLSVAAPLH
jgi:16S rRNA (uracil1498-N3)-methyltransferase